MAKTPVELVDRGLRAWRQDGVRQTAAKATRYAARRLGGDLPDLALDPGLVADSRRLALALPATRPEVGAPLSVGWVCTPPALGSGGHTTMFRMVSALEEAGHRCHIYLYDRFGGDLAAHERLIRLGWPEVRADVLDVSALPGGDAAPGLDACFATSWESAHVLASLGTGPMRRLYFVQDYEPYFYPRGSEYALAEDSYRFGFRCIALGGMVADCLTKEVGLAPDRTEFGCDTDVYHLTNEGQRSGVVCYARPGNPRRGYWLARLALQELHRRRPDVQVRLYGGSVADLGFPVEVHPRLTPSELNELYNRSVVGLALSFTNISLVAEELLAAGVVPVVNDAPEARADLDNPHVSWALPTASGLADALESALTSADACGRPGQLASSVRRGWSKARREVVRIVEDEVYGQG